MSESKHTPGPWRIAEDRDGEVVSGPQSNLIAQCFGSYAHNTVHQIDANCRLIAAAPALYEALEKLVEAASDSDDARYGTLSTGFVRDIANAALALARGEA